MKVKCGHCQKLFISQEHLSAHTDLEHPNVTTTAAQGAKRRGWATPYGFVDFKEPVTYEDALQVSELVNKRLRESHPHRFNKITDSKDVAP